MPGCDLDNAHLYQTVYSDFFNTYSWEMMEPACILFRVNNHHFRLFANFVKMTALFIFYENMIEMKIIQLGATVGQLPTSFIRQKGANAAGKLMDY